MLLCSHPMSCIMQVPLCTLIAQLEVLPRLEACTGMTVVLGISGLVWLGMCMKGYDTYLIVHIGLKLSYSSCRHRQQPCEHAKGPSRALQAEVLGRWRCSLVCKPFLAPSSGCRRKCLERQGKTPPTSCFPAQTLEYVPIHMAHQKQMS